jgi:hypothetical protein
MQHTHLMSSDRRVSVSSRPGALAQRANVIVEPGAWARAVVCDTRWAIALTAIVLVRLAGLFAFYRPATGVAKLFMGVVFQLLTITPLLVALALVFWTCAFLWGSRVTWPAAFSITVHMYFAYVVATTVVASVAGGLLPATVDVDLRHPPFTNLDFLVAADSQPLHAILGGLDIRSAYIAYLGSLGLRAATPGVTRGRIALVLGTCWVVLTVLEVARMMARR